MQILVTTGTFQFDLLIVRLLNCKHELITRFGAQLKMHIQFGLQSRINSTELMKNTELNIKFYPVLPCIQHFVEENNIELVVTHGGAGIITELLGRVPLICVSNPALSDNHQKEFLQELHKRQLITVASLETLCNVIETFKFTPLPPATPIGFNLELQKAIFIDQVYNQT